VWCLDLKLVIWTIFWTKMVNADKICSWSRSTLQITSSYTMKASVIICVLLIAGTFCIYYFLDSLPKLKQLFIFVLTITAWDVTFMNAIYTSSAWIGRLYNGNIKNQMFTLSSYSCASYRLYSEYLKRYICAAIAILILANLCSKDYFKFMIVVVIGL